MSATLAPPAVTAPPTPRTATANGVAATAAAPKGQAPYGAAPAAYRRRWYTLGVLCLSLLVIVVDSTIVNVALPTFARELHAGTSGLQWIVDAYTLTFAARTDHPMLPLRLFRNPRFAGAGVSITMLFFALSGVVFLTTQIYQFVLGYSPLAAGVRALPAAAALAVFSPVGTWMAKRSGVRLPVTLGLAVVAGGMAFFATSSAASGYGHYVLAMVIICTGIGLAMSAATSASMAELRPAQAGVGSPIRDDSRPVTVSSPAPSPGAGAPRTTFPARRRDQIGQPARVGGAHPDRLVRAARDHILGAGLGDELAPDRARSPARRAAGPPGHRSWPRPRRASCNCSLPAGTVRLCTDPAARQTVAARAGRPIAELFRAAAGRSALPGRALRPCCRMAAASTVVIKPPQRCGDTSCEPLCTTDQA